jgi:hypothetical protein
MGDASCYKPIIKFIRAAWCRCCIVSIYGHCYIWGTTFKGEHIKEPRLVFRDHNGIYDLKFGQKHAIYQQERNRELYSWGDATLGQTGNHYNDNEGKDTGPTHLDW